ncbi:MAG: hypothetical protein ACE5IG_05090 [Dehalococcoidia bacterium]
MDQETEIARWRVEPQAVEAYLEATEDSLTLYRERGLVPPAGLAAWALGSLLQWLALPPGAVHVAQEVEMQRPVQWGEELVCTARLAQSSLRGGSQFLVVEFALADGDGVEVLQGKATVLLPSQGGSP